MSEIIPYRTKVHCKNCGHMWKPRSKHPHQCPRCWEADTWDVVDEMDVMRWKVKEPQLLTGVPPSREYAESC